MDKDKKPIVKRPEVLKKLNADNLLLIERGLLGDLPNKLRPPPLVPTRDQSTELEVAKPSGILSACLPVIPDSPVSEKIAYFDDGSNSPLRKTFSFREKLSRISFFGKDKDKPKWKTIVEHEKNEDGLANQGATKLQRINSKAEHDYKSNKRFWFFRNKELEKQYSPIYQRSKSFEFLPRAIEEEDEQLSPRIKKNSQSFAGSSDAVGDAWNSNESLEYIANVYRDNDDGVCLKSFKEIPCDVSYKSSQNSTGSTCTSGSSANAENLLKTASVENVFDEFNKAVELFSENYLSDCESYAKSKKLTLKLKRRSSSFSNLPSPKIVQVNKVSEVSEDFMKELSKVLSVKRDVRTCRRGSVTDWFVLEDQRAEEANRYKRGKKKATNRVRRMSSTKYVSQYFL